MNEGIELDLSTAGDMAVLISLVPHWAELSYGLDLLTEEGALEYQQRLQEATDAAIEQRALEAQALSLLPPPDRSA